MFFNIITSILTGTFKILSPFLCISQKEISNYMFKVKFFKILFNSIKRNFDPLQLPPLQKNKNKNKK